MSKMSVGSLEVIYITLESVTGIFAVVGNALVTWAVKLNPALQKTTFFYFVSLALTDIAMGILVIPLAVMVSLGVIIHFYSCLFMCCLMMIFSHASILSLLAIAVDRYLRVKLPTRTQSLFRSAPVVSTWPKLLRTNCTELCLLQVRPTTNECLKAHVPAYCSSFF
ncbi:adenosine receptor A3-like isoform X3 [Falco rusticolus]|uniref:adenosine receptor A3-like isoform X3 n=1 Tax=Falco rusticolus TaxID=120794 RepID=UPI001886842F|nr:adenosine receptor A3-like isoform X3 [Falco rusticolus]